MQCEKWLYCSILYFISIHLVNSRGQGHFVLNSRGKEIILPRNSRVRGHFGLMFTTGGCR